MHLLFLLQNANRFPKPPCFPDLHQHLSSANSNFPYFISDCLAMLARAFTQYRVHDKKFRNPFCNPYSSYKTNWKHLLQLLPLGDWSSLMYEHCLTFLRCTCRTQTPSHQLQWALQQCCLVFDQRLQYKYRIVCILFLFLDMQGKIATVLLYLKDTVIVYDRQWWLFKEDPSWIPLSEHVFHSFSHISYFSCAATSVFILFFSHKDVQMRPSYSYERGLGKRWYSFDLQMIHVLVFLTLHTYVLPFTILFLAIIVKLNLLLDAKHTSETHALS